MAFITLKDFTLDLCHFIWKITVANKAFRDNLRYLSLAVFFKLHTYGDITNIVVFIIINHSFVNEFLNFLILSSVPSSELHNSWWWSCCQSEPILNLNFIFITSFVRFFTFRFLRFLIFLFQSFQNLFILINFIFFSMA